MPSAWDEWNLIDEAQHYCQWDGDVADHDDCWQQVGHPEYDLAGAVTGDAEVGGCRPDAVGQVQEEDHHCQDVEDCYAWALEGGDEVLVGGVVAVYWTLEAFWGYWLHSEGEVKDVEDDEQQQDDAGHWHGARSEGVVAADHVLALELAAGLVCAAGECEACPYVQDDGYEQHDAEYPEQALVWDEWVAEFAEEVCVCVEGGFSRVYLQVSYHMYEDEEAEDDAGDGHRQLHCPGWEARLIP